MEKINIVITTLSLLLLSLSTACKKHPAKMQDEAYEQVSFEELQSFLNHYEDSLNVTVPFLATPLHIDLVSQTSSSEQALSLLGASKFFSTMAEEEDLRGGYKKEEKSVKNTGSYQNSTKVPLYAQGSNDLGKVIIVSSKGPKDSVGNIRKEEITDLQQLRMASNSRGTLTLDQESYIKLIPEKLRKPFRKDEQPRPFGFIKITGIQKTTGGYQIAIKSNLDDYIYAKLKEGSIIFDTDLNKVEHARVAKKIIDKIGATGGKGIFARLKDTFVKDPSQIIFGQTLGKGGFGEVIEVKLGEDGASFALKRMENNSKNRNEIATLLDNPCSSCLTYYGASKSRDGRYLYLISELGGRSLTERISLKNGADTGLRDLDAKDMSNLAKQIDELNSAKVLHYDIKPDNILMVKEKDKEIPKIIDFGLTEIKPDSLSFGGSIITMAPEQILSQKIGAKEAGKVMVYQLGMVKAIAKYVEDKDFQSLVENRNQAIKKYRDSKKNFYDYLESENKLQEFFVSKIFSSTKDSYEYWELKILKEMLVVDKENKDGQVSFNIKNRLDTDKAKKYWDILDRFKDTSKNSLEELDNLFKESDLKPN